MKQLSHSQLVKLFKWASLKKDKRSKSLLERARESIEKGTIYKYNTSVTITDKVVNGMNVIEWDCDCPHAKHHNPDLCKHALARIILMHEDVLVKHSRKWEEWFKEYRKKLEKELEEFDQF